MSGTGLRTPLKQARGFGSAREGTRHWIAERATAAFLIPLTVFFLASIVAHAGADYATMIAYLAHPVVSIAMILLVLTGFYHMRLGLQVIVEDYIAKTSTRILLMLMINFLTYAVALACVLAVLHISFTR